MSKKFEEYFSELQADMVSICLEYAEGRAEKIYIYGSCENNSLSSTCFYCINGITVRRSQMNDAIKIKDKNSNFRYDESDDRQLGLLDVLSDDMDKILELHEEYQMEMPTEIKMVYDVTKNSLKAEYSYEIKYSNIKDKLSEYVVDEWFEEVQAENKNPDNVKYHTERLAILNRKDPEPEVILNWKIFDDFVLEEKASPEIIKKYKGKVNETVLEVWKRYGFGTILNGYLRFVNPDKYEEIMEDTTGKFESAIVVFTTANRFPYNL